MSDLHRADKARDLLKWTGLLQNKLLSRLKPCHLNQASPLSGREQEVQWGLALAGGWAGQGRVGSLLPQDSAGAMPWLGAQVQSGGDRECSRKTVFAR